RQDPAPSSSLLYSGEKLREAQRLLAEAASLLDAGEVAAFLQASEAKQRRFWRRVAGVSSLAALLLLISAGIAWLQADLAEKREVLATARMLSLSSRNTQGADGQLLVAAQALAMRDGPEARATLIDQLSHWSDLVGMVHLIDQEPSSVAIDDASQ